VIFSGYWIVFWQQYIALPIYIHSYIDAKANVELILVTDGATVIALQLLMSYLTRKIAPFTAILLGSLVTSLAFLVVALHPTVWGAVGSLIVLALGEITQAPRYYEYVSKLAPPGQQGTYMGFAFVPIGIGSLIGGPFGGRILHYFGEVKQQPQQIWYAVTAVGLGTTLLLWIYDRLFKPSEAAKT
jgi:MFS family permease